MVCPNCKFKNQQGTVFCQNCGTQFSKPETVVQKPKKSKNKIIIAIVSVFLVFSIIAVAVASVVVVQLFSYRCADCNKFVIFEEHVIMSEDGEFGRWVCNQCHNNWMSEEYGVTFSGETVTS